MLKDYLFLFAFGSVDHILLEQSSIYRYLYLYSKMPFIKLHDSCFKNINLLNKIIIYSHFFISKGGICYGYEHFV